VAGLKVNLGSGDSPLPGFLNVDALAAAPGVDLVADVSQPLPLEDGTADLVYASHVLEHFPHAQTLDLLRDWRRLLRSGGQLMVAVPDLDVIARMLRERRGWFTPPNAPWVGAIYGGQKDDYDFHKAGFTAPWLAYLLSEAGFGSVRRVDRFEGMEREGSSHSPAPFGVNVSLNMIGVAGGERLPDELLRPAGFERAFFAVDRLFEHSLNLSSRIRARLMERRRRRLEHAIGAARDS
jgi:predicted SAM-dependent methyltransferase